MTLGDLFDSYFREFLSNSCGNPVGTNGDDIKMTQMHNSLFLLFPSDEMLIIWRSNTTTTNFFKYAVPKFGEDSKLSCTLVFWYTIWTEEFNTLKGKRKQSL